MTDPQTDEIESGTRLTLNSDMPFRWRAILIAPTFTGLGWRNRLRYWWGNDIWFRKVPVFKTQALLAVIYIIWEHR